MRKDQIEKQLNEYVEKNYQKEQERFDDICLSCEKEGSKPFKIFIKNKYQSSGGVRRGRCYKAVNRIVEKSIEKTPPLKEYIKVVDESFIDTIFKIIDKRKLDDVDVYKKANIDRKLFSKLRAGGHPSKNTAIALCIALKLSYEETINLLARAGYTLSKSVLFDVIISFFIENKEYRIDVINSALIEHDQKTLGPV